MRDLAGKHTESAINALVNIMSSETEPAASRVSAAKEILDRGFGKSGNYAIVETDIPLSEMSPSEAITTIGDLVAAGKMPVDDGAKLTGIIEARTRAIEMANLEERLAALEGKQ